MAQEYCKGLSDKEVADNLCRSYWTIKTQKKAIYKKLGISKDTELLWWCLCEKMRIPFNLNVIRKYGTETIAVYGRADELEGTGQRTAQYYTASYE